MNQDPMQWLVTREMPCGMFGWLLALLLGKGRGNLVCKNNRVRPFMLDVRRRTRAAIPPLWNQAANPGHP
ncbi:MAG: hypothetical protein ACLQHK_01265 [Gallionellaceae bacterium]